MPEGMLAASMRTAKSLRKTMKTAFPGIVTPREAAPRLALAWATSPMRLPSIDRSRRSTRTSNACFDLAVCVPGYGALTSDLASGADRRAATIRSAQEARRPRNGKVHAKVKPPITVIVAGTVPSNCRDRLDPSTPREVPREIVCRAVRLVGSPALRDDRIGGARVGMAAALG